MVPRKSIGLEKQFNNIIARNDCARYAQKAKLLSAERQKILKKIILVICMSSVYYNPYALCVYVDGSAPFGNPGRAGGISATVEFPEKLNLESRDLFKVGFSRSNNQRMELLACIRALKEIRELIKKYDIPQAVIITDSDYVYQNQARVEHWKKCGWENKEGRPIENPRLWNEFLAERRKVGMPVEIIWQKGKTTAITKQVDKNAKKAASRTIKERDSSYLYGRISRTKISFGSASMFPARGQEMIIRVYRSEPKITTTQKMYKIFFEEFSETEKIFINKYFAYASIEIEADLHRAHYYKVLFNENPKYSKIEKIIGEILPCDVSGI